jgi:hypothetical protein|tara:strand:+ start:642 stop:812 length:171 start_codon:yes stop_codon:yes gene_type:complete
MEMTRFNEGRHSERDFIEMCNASIGINYAQIDDSFGRGMIEALTKKPEDKKDAGTK